MEEIRSIEQALRVRDAELEKTLRAIPDALIFTDKQNRITKINPAVEKLFGYKPEELYGKEIKILYADGMDFQNQGEIRCNVDTKGMYKPYEIRYRKKGGEVFLSETVGSHIVNDKNEVMGLVASIRDITDRKQAEDKLQESADRCRTIVETIPQGICEMDPSGIITYANSTHHRILGYEDGELTGISIFDLIADDSIKSELSEYLAILVKEEPLPSPWFGRDITKDGRIINVEVNWDYKRDKNGAVIGFISLLTDLTQKCQAENALRESEERYRTLFENAINPILIIDTEGNYLDCNDAALRFLECTKDELLVKNVKHYIFPGKENVVLDAHKPFWESGGRFETEYYVNGKIKILDLFISPAILRGRHVIFGIGNDITERKQAEEALKESEKRLRMVVGNMPILLDAFDENRNILFWNKECERVTGFSEKEMIGNPDTLRLVYPDPLKLKQLFEEWGKKGDEFYNWEIELKTKDGNPRIVSWSNISKRYPIPGWASWSIGVDVTEKKRMEEELLKLQKLESIGILAGGIAHDFNNLLTPIMGNLSLAKIYSSPGDEIFALLTEAEKATKLAKTLTQQLLTFSKGGTPIMKSYDVSQLIRDSVGFSLRGSNVKYKLSIPEDVWWVRVDADQISQVIQNIVINADQAMPKGGLMHVSAENIIIGPMSVLPIKEGKYVKISIEDQGVGIPEENLIKIFDPYFTTKQKGSGLGLAVCHSIIKKHHGYIEVKSKSEKGSTFSVYLPASEDDYTEGEIKEGEIISSRGRILLVDDEDMVLKTTSLMLKQIGYTIETARDGSECIELYKNAKEAGNPFDIIILDLTIPGGIGGKEIMTRLLKINPGIRAIVSSGYSNDPIMADYKKYGFCGVITKPYGIKELSEILEIARRS